jgi:predicted nucleic acid-binding protein
MPGDEATAVVDASVAIKWLVDEPHSDAASALLERPIAWVAPRLLLVETAARLRRKVADRELTDAGATTALRTLVDAARDGTVRLADDEDLAADALLLALELRHKLPDCLYLALAEREGSAVATADSRLGRLARSRGVPVLGIGAAGAGSR